MIDLLNDDAETTLDGGISDTDSTLDIVTIAGSPSTAPFRIWIDDEIFIVTAIAGDTYSIIRGVEGSVAAPHSDGASIFYPLSAGVDVQQEVEIARRVVGPSSSVDGNLVIFDGPSGRLIKDGGAPSSGGSGMLAIKQWLPGTVTVVSTSSSTFADIDSTNLKITFVAPASGNVMFGLSAFCDTDNSQIYAWRLYDGSSQQGQITGVSRAGQGTTVSAWIYVSGLTPGNTYTDWKWQHAQYVSGTGRVVVDQAGGGTGFPPATMIVMAAP